MNRGFENIPNSPRVIETFHGVSAWTLQDRPHWWHHLGGARVWLSVVLPYCSTVLEKVGGRVPVAFRRSISFYTRMATVQREDFAKRDGRLARARRKWSYIQCQLNCWKATQDIPELMGGRRLWERGRCLNPFTSQERGRRVDSLN